jgi:serine/threonine-protein kinase PpkA
MLASTSKRVSQDSAPALPCPTLEGAQAGTPTVATFLYARLHNFAAVCQCFSGDELNAFVNETRHLLSNSILRLGGEIAQRRPDSILALFSNDPDRRKPDHAQRGLHAAILSVHETVQLARRVAARPNTSGVPALTLSVGVHLGGAEVRASGRSNAMVHAVGEAVEIARMLQVTATDLRWSVVASGRTVRAAAGRAEGGRIGSIGTPDNSFIDIVEITALLPRSGSKTPPSKYGTLRDAIALNQQSYSKPPDLALPDQSGNQAAPYFLIEGYRILRKIGEGGMASIYLAQQGTGDELQVLKIIPLDSMVESDGLQRFIQEYALLAQMNHRNVARIFRQDFSAGHAYIAMEYFPRGDLRARIAAGMDLPLAVAYLKQIAGGLGAIHAAGIVHRDLKPGNLMLRHDGSLALADFGVAKQVFMHIMDTGHGDVMGTPTYLSPEQACGQSVDARCDLYSLGVLTYEMLTGVTPYRAATARALLELHVNAPVPRLRRSHAALQPVLDRLMAKDREQRYASAQALLEDLAQRGL